MYHIYAFKICLNLENSSKVLEFGRKIIIILEK